MARIPTLNKPEDLSDAQRKIYEMIGVKRGAVRGPFTIMLHNPELAKRTSHLGEYIRFESHLSTQTCYVAALVTSRVMDCDFEFSTNAEHGEEAGLSESVVAAIRDRTAPAGLDEEQALVFRVGTELLTGRYRISPDTFEAAMKFYGQQALIDLVATFGYYSHIACILNAFEMEPRTGYDPLPA